MAFDYSYLASDCDYPPDGYPMELRKRDFNPKSPTFMQDLMVLPILGPEMNTQGLALLSGYTGFYHTPITQIRENGAYQEGSTPSEYPRVEERILDFRIGVRGRNWAEFKTVETLLWWVMKPAPGEPRDFVLRLYHGPGEDDWREITIRLERAPKDQFELGPGLFKQKAWDITALACDPYWYSRTLQDTVTFDTGTGSGATRVSERTLIVSNNGDQRSWLQYASNELEADSTFTLPDALGVYPDGHDLAGERIALTLPTLGVDRSFLVRTYPMEITLEVYNDSQAVALMDDVGEFENWLPPHTVDAELPVKLVGGTVNTQLSVYAEQRWDRCFGGEAL